MAICEDSTNLTQPYSAHQCVQICLWVASNRLDITSQPAPYNSTFWVITLLVLHRQLNMRTIIFHMIISPVSSFNEYFIRHRHTLSLIFIVAIGNMWRFHNSEIALYCPPRVDMNILNWACSSVIKAFRQHHNKTARVDFQSQSNQHGHLPLTWKSNVTTNYF